MNVARGLLRAWMVLSIIWIAAAGTAAFVMVSPDLVRGSFQPGAKFKDGSRNLKDGQIATKPFYEIARSPYYRGVKRSL